jgi:hypothetical protein
MIDPRRPPARRPARWPAGLAAAAGLLAGCNGLHTTPPPTGDRSDGPVTVPAFVGVPVAAPGQFHLRLSQYVFYTDFELKKDAPLLRELSDLRDQVYAELKLPAADNVVQVFLFPDRDPYERFMRQQYPKLPIRRAFFVAQPRTAGGSDELLVYTFAGEHVRQDLRHELTHALLHSVLRDVPLWLDEGLAEFFELPPETQGVNAQHLDILRRGPFTPDLARLERLTEVADMRPPEYREAWAWAHLMLRGRPEAKAVLLGYLQQLRTVPNPGPVSSRLQAVLTDLKTALEQHLAQVERPGGVATTAAAGR